MVRFALKLTYKDNTRYKLKLRAMRKDKITEKYEALLHSQAVLKTLISEENVCQHNLVDQNIHLLTAFINDLSELTTEDNTSEANLNIPDVSNSFCECKTPKYNYPEMLWCDTCGKEINEDKQKEELLIAYTKWQYQDDSFDEADKLMVKTFLKDYKGNL